MRRLDSESGSLPQSPPEMGPFACAGAAGAGCAVRV